jgi:citrate lyase subunit beta/citryl-CoA lyase
VRSAGSSHNCTAPLGGDRVHAPNGAVGVLHRRVALIGSQGTSANLPVCDHYSGVDARMVKSLQLRADMITEFGVCVFDVTLDCEDGAPIGGEAEQALRILALANAACASSTTSTHNARRRLGVRVHPVGHSAFDADVQTIVGQAAQALRYIMVPKVETVDDVIRAVSAVDAATPPTLQSCPLPIHVLIESPAAVHRVFEIAAHPRVQSLSFGLMDFVSVHGGAIPSMAMAVRPVSDTHSLDQFHHPLVLRAKMEIASACHAHGKVPSHCVVTEFRDTLELKRAANTASAALGSARMWSIHPDQIRPILEAFTPSQEEVDLASEIVVQAQSREWAPMAFRGRLHDRASYRYYWQVLERAHQTGVVLGPDVNAYFSSTVH